MPNSPKPRFRRWRLAAAASLLSIAALAGLHFLEESYLQGDAFRRALDDRISNYLKADAHFSALTGNCASLHAGQFEAAANGRGCSFAHVAAEDIRGSLSPIQLILHQQLYMDHVEVDKLDVDLGGEPASPASKRPDSRGFEVGDINIHQLNIGVVRGVHLAMKRNLQGWTVTGAGGSVERPGFPPLAAEKAEGEASADRVLVQSAILHGSSGTVRLGGNVQFTGERTVALDGSLTSLPLESILPDDWRAQISGPASGAFHVSGSLNGLDHLETSGHLTMEHGVIEALPILRKLPPFLGSLDRFREVRLTDSSADFTMLGSEIQIRNLLLKSPGLCQIQGSLNISPSGAMIGELEFGVAPPGGLAGQAAAGVLDQVFTEAHDGYRWTNVHVSGTTSFPAEDLSPRISAAAANEIKAKGTSALKSAADFFGGLINN